MIVKKQSFEYQNKVLIEKAILEAPYRHEGVFQNQGCFLYIKGAEGKVLSSHDNFEFDKESKEAVLLKCDTYFLDFIKSTQNNKIELIAVHLYPELLKKLYIHELPKLIQKESNTPKTKHVVDEVVIAKFIDSLDFYFETPSLVNEDLLELKIKELVLLLIQTKNIDSILELINDLYTKRISTLREILELHLYSNLSVEELAKLSGMSLSSFKREFKKQFGDSPLNYINTEKIKKAKDLLSLPELSISDIAYEVGFNDPLYFTRLFKKKEGKSPTEFRASLLN